MHTPGRPPNDPIGAIRWSPDELELDEAPFGGPSVAFQPAPRNDNAHLVHQQALDEAYSHGFDAGREAGATAERERLANAMASITAMLAELREREAKWTAGLEENLCALAVAVGRQLFDAELQAAPTHAVVLVKRALTEFPIDQPVAIRVNPLDLASITASSVVEGSSAAINRPDAQWIPDPRVLPGGCLIEGRDRIVDGRVDTALERLYRRLTGTGA
jgi:flagellar biosynthesis/type III secretory pathway protein FliH